MSIRQVVLATIVAAGFSFTASAAPVVKQAPVIPGAQLNLIPRAGHLVAFEQAATFNEVVRNWLAWGSNGLSRNALQPAGAPARQA